MDERKILDTYLSALSQAYDPHSDYLDPETAKEFENEIFKQSFTGIGAELKSEDGYSEIVRLVPGVMGNETSAARESFADALLEEPQYTRPARFRGWDVPEILRSGDHARIERWRRAQALHRTVRDRPDLIAARGGLTEDDRRLLEEFDPVAYP